MGTTLMTIKTCIWHTSKSVNLITTRCLQSEVQRFGHIFCPDELWLIITEPKISLDQYINFSGYLALDRFLNILDPADLANFKISKLRMVSCAGDTVTDRQMNFMKFRHGTDAVDQIHSILNKNEPAAQMRRCFIRTVGLSSGCFQSWCWTQMWLVT